MGKEGDNYITCSNDETVKVWSLEHGCQKVLKGHSSFVFDVCHNMDKNLLVSASDDRNVHAWEMGSGKIIAKLLHPNTIWCCELSPLNDIITGCADGAVRIFTFDKSRYASQEEVDTYTKETKMSVNNTQA